MSRYTDYDEAVMADECEQAATIAAIWKTHPDYPEDA